MKKILLIAIMAIFTTGAFAGVTKGNAKTLKTKNLTAASTKVSECFTLDKTPIPGGCCEFSWYNVAAVVTVKKWCDGRTEVFIWHEQSSLLCH